MFADDVTGFSEARFVLKIRKLEVYAATRRLARYGGDYISMAKMGLGVRRERTSLGRYQ